MRGRVCFLWQFLCYHFVFVFSPVLLPEVRSMDWMRVP